MLLASVLRPALDLPQGQGRTYFMRFPLYLLDLSVCCMRAQVLLPPGLPPREMYDCPGCSEGFGLRWMWLVDPHKLTDDDLHEFIRWRLEANYPKALEGGPAVMRQVIREGAARALDKMGWGRNSRAEQTLRTIAGLPLRQSA